MIVYIEIHQYIPSKSRPEYYSKQNHKAHKECFEKTAQNIKKFISKILVRMQKRTLSKVAKNFSNNVPNFDYGLICSNLSNLMRKKKIDIPNICHIFQLKIPYSLFYDKMFDKYEIENFFFHSGKKTDRFIFFEKSYIQKRIGINLSGKKIYNTDFSPQNAEKFAKKAQVNMAHYLQDLYHSKYSQHSSSDHGDNSPEIRRKFSSLENHVYNEKDIPESQIQNLDNLEIRFSLVRNEELEHLEHVKTSHCYYSIEDHELIVKE